MVSVAWGRYCPALLLLLTGSPALADDLAPAPSVQLYVHGTLPQTCMMGAPGGVDFGDLNRPTLTADVAVGLVCNVPFTINVRAEHGALTNDLHPNGEGPYAGALQYRLGLSVPVERPQPDLVEESFDSRALQGGQTLSSGGGIADHGMTLHVALAPPASEAGLVAGTYSETIVITVAPS